MLLECLQPPKLFSYPKFCPPTHIVTIVVSSLFLEGLGDLSALLYPQILAHRP